MNISESFLNTSLGSGEPAELAQRFLQTKREAYTGLRSWEVNRRNTYVLLKGMADNLLRNLQGVNKLAGERMAKLEAFFRNFRVQMRLTFAGISNFGEFRLTRTKRQSSNRRSTVENNDLFDLVVNFKEELQEFEERVKTLEKTVNEGLAVKLLREQTQPREETVANLTAQAVSLKDKVEKYESTTEREFDHLIEACIRALERQKHSTKGTDFDVVTRKTFEPFATFLSVSTAQMESLRKYFATVLDLFEASRKLEADRNAAAKTLVEKFTEAFGDIYGDSEKAFTVSRHLGESLDPQRVADFQFDLAALLLCVEIEAVQKRCGQKEMTTVLLQQFADSFASDDWIKLINAMTVAKFRGQLQEESGTWAPATVYQTIENTFVVYKKTTQTFWVATIFPDSFVMTPADADGIYTVKYAEKGAIWTSSKQLRLQLPRDVAERLAEARETALRVAAVEVPLNESFSLGASMVRPNGSSPDHA